MRHWCYPKVNSRSMCVWPNKYSLNPTVINISNSLWLFLKANSLKASSSNRFKLHHFLKDLQFTFYWKQSHISLHSNAISEKILEKNEGVVLIEGKRRKHYKLEGWFVSCLKWLRGLQCFRSYQQRYISEQRTADLLKDAWQLLLSHSSCFIIELNSHKDSVFSLVNISAHRQ